MKAGTAILEAFYQAAGQFVPVTHFERLLKRPSRDVSAQIAELQKLGYVIEAHPHLGYRLLDTPDRLTADDLKARLQQISVGAPFQARPGSAGETNRARKGAPTIGSEILVFDETGSTNDVVDHLGRSGAREGLVVFAESQTRGRGRQGRVWVSPRGKGLWFSVLLRPKFPRAAASRLTVAASVAVAETLRRFASVDARIKWPNDVTVRGKKLAGILTEMRDVAASVPDASFFAAETAATTPLMAILGIGIDVNCLREDFAPELTGVATSLQIETGHQQDRSALAVAMLAALDACYQQAQENFDAIVERWAQLCTTLGRQLVVTTGNRQVEGHAQALNGDGALLLRRDSGQIEQIVGADVVVER